MKKLPLLLFVFAILMLLAFAWRSPFTTRSSASHLNDSMARQARTGADEATLAARDASQRLVQFTVRNAGDREAALELGTIIEDYGSFVVIAMDRDKAAQALQENHDLVAIETTVSLRGITFEPLEEPLAKAFDTSSGNAALKGETGGDYYIVQFAAPVRDEWLEEIRAAGGDVIQYVPNQAFFVFATVEAMATIAQHPRVRWTGAFHPADNAPPQMRALTATRRNLPAATGVEKGLFDISVFKNKDLDVLAKAVLDFGVTIRNKIVLPNNYFNVLRVEMEPGLSLPVLQISGVISIEPYIPPMREDERAAQVLAGNFISTTQLSLPGYNSLSQFGVDGAGVTVSVVDDGVGIPGDGGFYITSANAVNAPLRGAQGGAEGHGHLNATIIAGDSPFSVLDPLGYSYGLGIARKAHVVNIPLLRAGYTGTEADTCNDTVVTAGPNGVKGFISNNSWGAGTNSNAYDSYAAQYDGFVRDSSAAATIDPLLIVFSAGNQGAVGLTRPKVAKNLIAVANSENIRTELSSSANNIDDLNSSSSRGPAADGRIKPDITAPGTAISGGRSGTDVLFGNIDSVHRWSSGTSHAAPQIAGAAALFTQFWKNNNAGVNPSPALVKAALINGAQEMNGAGTSATIPNGAEGWGRLNLQNVLNTGVATKYVNETSTLSSVGSEVIFTGAVASFTRQFRVSLVWTDPPGMVDPALVNNLDLEVTVGGTTYKGNVFSNGLSASGGSADTRNNVENVFLPAGLPPGTTVTIRIRATGLNGDGALGNGDPTDQHFALVAFNYTDGAGCNYGINPTSQTSPAIGGSGAVNVSTDPGCNWTAASNATWLQINGATSGAGNGLVNYTVFANNGPQRAGTMTIAGQTFTITQSGNCPGINLVPAILPDGTVGTVYNQTIAAGGGGGLYTFTVAAGALPNGLSLSSAGALAGTPTAIGAFSFTIQVADAIGCAGTQAYTVTISSQGLMFYPLPQPIRLLDTRPGQSACDTPGAPINAETDRTQLARRTCGGITIPSNALAITGNITPVSSVAGYLTLYPSGTARQLVAGSNYNVGEINNNVFTVGLGADGSFKIYAASTTHVVIDVSGYYAPPGDGGLYFHPLPSPVRLLDTRPGEQGCTAPGLPINGGSSMTQSGRMTCGSVAIPNTAEALIGNVTAITPTAAGYLTIYPNIQVQPLVASGNYVGGDIVNTPFTAGLGTDGAFRIFTVSTTHLVMDIMGYYSPEASDQNGAGFLFYPLGSPVRLLDTRAGQIPCFAPNAPLNGGVEYAQQARGLCGGQTVATNAVAVVGNATTVNPQADSYLTFWPSNTTRPLVANSNFNAGQIANRHFTVGLGPDGAFRMFSVAATELVIDLSGYYAP
ncbi:MAG: S8 family serine peptidase [Acidobacteriota bacterium]